MSTVAMDRWRRGGVVGSQGVNGTRRWSGGRRQPAPAPASSSPDGLGVGPGGVGVGFETNGSEVAGRGVLVGEGVDGGEGGRRGGSAAPALGLCLAPGPDWKWQPEKDPCGHVKRTPHRFASSISVSSSGPGPLVSIHRPGRGVWLRPLPRDDGCHQIPSLRSERVHDARSATAVNPHRGGFSTLRPTR